MYCYHCGEYIEDDSAFCKYCGADQRSSGGAGVPPVPVEMNRPASKQYSRFTNRSLYTLTDRIGKYRRFDWIASLILKATFFLVLFLAFAAYVEKHVDTSILNGFISGSLLEEMNRDLNSLAGIMNGGLLEFLCYVILGYGIILILLTVVQLVAFYDMRRFDRSFDRIFIMLIIRRLTSLFAGSVIILWITAYVKDGFLFAFILIDGAASVLFHVFFSKSMSGILRPHDEGIAVNWGKWSFAVTVSVILACFLRAIVLNPASSLYQFKENTIPWVLFVLMAAEILRMVVWRRGITLLKRSRDAIGTEAQQEPVNY